MTDRRADIRQLAALDLEEAATYYQQEGGEAVALRFVDAAERCVRQITRSPLIGSLQFAYELGIPDLRAVPIIGFPCVLFYRATDAGVDVWRVLHTKRDLRSLVGEDAG